MKCRITHLAIFLFLGAIVNVAIAWGVANLLAEQVLVRRVLIDSRVVPNPSWHNWPLEEKQGWPMQSFSEQLTLNEYSSVDTVIEFKNAKLAYGPIWPGIAINTFLYATLLWMLTLAPFQLRRHIRRKRGACLKCGYDLNHADHDICPECGCVCIDCAK